MFSGITKGLYKINSVTHDSGILNYTVQLSPELVQHLKIGDSVSVNGVCQTVIKLDDINVSFQAIQETLDKTTLGELTIGCNVSIERSLRFGEDVGGHEVSGHVFGTATIFQRLEDGDNLSLIIQCNPQWMKYIIEKGFIAVDGSSLTVGDTIAEQGLFYLYLIPETLRVTNFPHKQVGDKVNIEFDCKTKTIVDTVEHFMLNHAGSLYKNK